MVLRLFFLKPMHRCVCFSAERVHHCLYSSYRILLWVKIGCVNDIGWVPWMHFLPQNKLFYIPLGVHQCLPALSHILIWSIDCLSWCDPATWWSAEWCESIHRTLRVWDKQKGWGKRLRVSSTGGLPGTLKVWKYWVRVQGETLAVGGFVTHGRHSSHLPREKPVDASAGPLRGWAASLLSNKHNSQGWREQSKDQIG